MRKKIKLVIITAIIVLVSGFLNINYSNVGNGYDSSLKLADIKVLASALAEGGGSQLLCYDSMSSDGTGNLTHITYCGDCSAHLARSWRIEKKCSK